MKLCPTCQRTYTDDSMKFCLEDGTPLADAPSGRTEPAATLISPAPLKTDPAATEVLTEEALGYKPARTQPGRQPAATTGPAPAARRLSPLPWILAIVAVLGLSGIVVAYILTRTREPDNALTAQTETPTPTPASLVASPSPVLASETTGVQQEEAAASPNQPASTPTRQPSPEKTAEKPSPTPLQKPSPLAAPSTTPNTVQEEEVRPNRRGPITGGVLNGKAISLPKPAYPAIAKTARASGVVVVQILVDENGSVIAARPISGHPLLRQAAASAARQARFTPTTLAGQPVKVTGVVTYNFTLD
ncbi:MAG TPA: TonB family protein [Pyrinomonadaceae bacterium]|jgi:TonB family protein